MRKKTIKTSKNIKGLTLVELLFAIVIVAIVSALAIPSYTHMLDRNQLVGASEKLAADIQFARMESIKRNTSVRMTFKWNNTSTWCYGLKENSDCDCEVGSSDPNYCEIDSVGKVVSNNDYRGIKIDQPNFALDSDAFTFTPVRGTVNGGTVEFENAGAYQLDVVVSRFGRVRICSPSSNKLWGYKKCQP